MRASVFHRRERSLAEVLGNATSHRPHIRPRYADYCAEGIEKVFDVATADVNFEFTTTDKTVLVSAHKCLLAHQSPVFRQMFFSRLRHTADSITRVKMVDATSEEFREFISCFYYEPTTITATNVRALTYLTHKYDVKLFENRCKAFLSEMVEKNIQSIFWVLPMATLFSYEELQQMCFELIRSKGRILIEHLPSAECTLDTLRSVLNIQFNERNEARVFEKCVSWAMALCEEKGLNPTSREDVRDQLGDCYHLIRFDSMSPKQFVQCLSQHSFVFHPDEIGPISQTVKGQEQEFVRVDVPPMETVIVINKRFEPSFSSLLNDVDTADIYFTFGASSGQQEEKNRDFIDI